MIATLPFLEEKFRKFNNQMFGGQLPEIPLALSKAKGSLGQFTYKRRRRLLGGDEIYDLKIRISTRLDLPQDELEDILIHEMIHYYIHYRNLQDTSTHGQVFHRVMDHINTRFHRHINVSHHSTEEQKEALVDKTVKPHVVAVVAFSDGKYGIKVLPRTLVAIRKYTSGVGRAPGVKEIQLYISTNPYFNAFPSSSAFRIHYLEKAIIDENLANAQHLTIPG